MNIKIFLDFMKQAGEIALKNQKDTDNLDHHFKSERVSDIVTLTDIQISELFKDFVKDHIEEDYIIIDEETIKDIKGDKFEEAEKHEYQIVLDPIDGTLPYSQDMPLYGVSIGILKNMKPYAGMVYAPSLKELVYSDNKTSYLIKDIFNEKEKQYDLKNIDNKSRVIFPNPWLGRLDEKSLNRNNYILLNLYSAVVHGMYMASGRARAYYFCVYIWDLAGVWYILKSVGMGVFNANNGKELLEFSKLTFDEKLKIKDPHIICFKEDFEYLKSIIEN